MKTGKLSPIVLFVYNRPWHTRQTIEALQKNDLAAQSRLIIFSDGPKTQEDSLKVDEVREYLKTVRRFESVQLFEQKENLGLANSIINGVTQTIKEYGRVIVLEDDLVTSPYFLKYMNEALDLYAQVDQVISIHGYVYPVKSPLPETFFIKGSNCWGWATWKRGWDLFERDGKVLLQKLTDQELTQKFDYNGAYPYTEMLKAQIAGKNNSWAIRWHASAFLNDKLTLYPGRSLVGNTGHEGSGTHSGVTDVFNVQLANVPVHVDKIILREHSDVRQSFEDHFRSMRSSPGAKFKHRVKKVFTRIFSNGNS